MDNSGFMSLNIGMNIVSSQASTSGQIIQQLPGIHQIFTHNATVKPTDTLQNVIQVCLYYQNDAVFYPSLYQ